MEKCEGEVMGVTYMTSVCRPDKACLVCVDEGLLLANTITHQIGHSLGADHDSGDSSGCAEKAPDGTNFHMAARITETSNAWSVCSRDSIIQFLKTQGSWCLTDLPVEKSFNFPLILPGQIYSAPQQCKLNFHMTALPCAVGSFCDRLYCQVTEKLCATKGDPPADGTFCASNMWCFHKECVHIGRRPGAVNGEWSFWTEWSICTRSCGGGISSSYRICNNPKPEKGGRYCIGDRIRHRMCATNPCQGFTESFRDLQCKKTEERPFRGRLHNWFQYHSFFLNIECALVCQNSKGDVVMRSPIVADGTPCKAGTRNVCIQGACRNVGCDWVIDSNAREDSCGICRGNSTECRIIQGVFDEYSTQKGLVEFLRVPKDAGMIFVREIAPSENVLVVTGSINRVFYLNGGGVEDSMPGDIAFGQAHGVYEVRSSMERIFIRGPILEELVFHSLLRGPNKGVHYQYAIMETDTNYVPRYLWQYVDWDACTDPCSGGSQRAHAKCVEDKGGVVDDQFCTESSRPQDVIRPCNDFPCQAKWWVSVWSDCICTGETSVMFRSVLCMRATDESGTRSEVVKESECANRKKPPTQKSCNGTAEDEVDCVKRSIPGESMFGGHKDIRRAVNPTLAYASYSSPDLSDLPFQEPELMPVPSDKESKENKQKEMSNEHLNTNKPQKKSITKAQINKNVNVKGAVNKVKPKSPEKEAVQLDKKKLTALKSKNAENLKPAMVHKSPESEESKSHLKSEDLSFAPDKGKQVANLNVKVAALNGEESSMSNSVDSKQSEDGESSESGGDTPELCEESESSTEPSCPTVPQETEPTRTTCKNTCAAQPHKKTTCCRTPPHGIEIPKATDMTTMRPVQVNVDELNMNEFALTVVPLDSSNKKKLPQSDPEFINLGNIGQYSVGDQANSTILSGQEALDFLEFARSNASEEPIILHDAHN
uniref:Peptidase M12B domain-containing protein n=1 Tax=Graphocephala atropunctata TaxID=36148 RepID=A0A1B6M4F3_9HEMI